MYLVVHLISLMNCAEAGCVCLQEVRSYPFCILLYSLNPFLLSFFDSQPILIQGSPANNQPHFHSSVIRKVFPKPRLFFES